MNNSSVNLYTFLKKGVFNGVKIGMGKSELINEFQSSLTPSFSLDESIGYYLGVIEIIVYKEVVSNIVINGIELKNVSIASSQASFSIKRQTSLDQLAKLFEKIHIKWKFSKDYSTDKSIAIVTEGGVYILFDYSEGRVAVEKIAI